MLMQNCFAKSSVWLFFWNYLAKYLKLVKGHFLVPSFLTPL